MDEAETAVADSRCVSSLSVLQKLQIEKKRQRALQLRKAKVLAHSTRDSDGVERPSRDKNRSRRQPNEKDVMPTRMIDTGGGFLIEEDACGNKVETVAHPIYDEGPLLAGNTALCEECSKPFFESYLHTKFSAFVCDKCRGESQVKHRLITKSEAKTQYLLQDSDFDRRDPPLKYMLKKNPRNDAWGDMKLYYEPQIQKRAYEIWGSENAIKEEKERRKVHRVKAKQKQFDKKMKELKMAVRSSLYRKNTGAHSHEYGPETCLDDEAGEYHQTCTTCGHILVFEKL